MVAPTWYSNPAAFFSPSRMLEIVPTYDLSYRERLDRTVRAVMYVSLVSYLFTRSSRAIYPLVLVLIGTYWLGSLHDKESFSTNRSSTLEEEEIINPPCVTPTKNNPFMNVLMNDFVDEPDRPKACDVNTVDHDITKNFQNDLYQDVTDVYSRDASIRQFYTTPSTTIPNDQDTFARWLYGQEGLTCKEGSDWRCQPWSRPGRS